MTKDIIHTGLSNDGLYSLSTLKSSGGGAFIIKLYIGVLWELYNTLTFTRSDIRYVLNKVS